MRNFWLNKIDKALRALGYPLDVLETFTEKEKEALLVDEYLYLLKEDREDCLSMTPEEMAEYLINYVRQAAIGGF